MELELLADVLKAWLRIQQPNQREQEWLIHWLLSYHSQPGEAQQILEAVSLFNEDLRQVFVERLNFSLLWAANHPEVGPQLVRDLSILASIHRYPMVSATPGSSGAPILPRRSSS